MPRRRYQIPSPVSHASSALIEVPSLSRIFTGPRFAPSALVPIGLVLSATCVGCALTAGVGVGVAVGEGDGEGVAVGDGDEDNSGGGGDIWARGWFDNGWVEFTATVSFVSRWYTTKRITPSAIAATAAARTTSAFLLLFVSSVTRVVPSYSQNWSVSGKLESHSGQCFISRMPIGDCRLGRGEMSQSKVGRWFAHPRG